MFAPKPSRAPANLQTAANVAAIDTPNVTLLKINRPLADKTITSVVLTRARVGPTGMKALARVLKDCEWVTTVDITEGYIGADAMGVLAEALETNTTVTSLRIDVDRIDAAATVKLAKMVAANETLTSLVIKYDTVMSTGYRVIAAHPWNDHQESEAATRDLVLATQQHRRRWSFLDLRVPMVYVNQRTWWGKEINRELDWCTARRTLLAMMFWKEEAAESPHKNFLRRDGDHAVAARVLGCL